MKAYRIVDVGNGGALRTLFHGTNRSRDLPVNEWLEADVRPVRDGSGDRWYLSGWHSLPSYDAALQYLDRFSDERQRHLLIIEVEVLDTWDKAHSPNPVILSRWMRIP